MATLARYRTPGVYYERRDPPPRLYGVRTDIAGFVGIAQRGPVMAAPARVESPAQFASLFGGAVANGYLAYAVAGFFANGGRVCYVVRLGDATRTRWAVVTLPDDRGRPSLSLRATSPGAWGNDVRIAVTRHRERFTLALEGPGGLRETFAGLTSERAGPEPTTPGDERDQGERAARVREAGTVINRVERSAVVTAEVAPGGGPPAAGVTYLTGGADGLSTLSTGHYQAALDLLASVDEVAILAVPDLMDKPVTAAVTVPPPPPRCDDLAPAAEPYLPPPQAPPVEYPPSLDVEAVVTVQQAMVGQCELLRDRFALLDLPDGLSPEDALAWREAFVSPFAALYYPWLLVPDPLQGPSVAAPRGTPRATFAAWRAVPASGHIAGVYARSDLATGVHKAPVNQELEGAVDVATAVDDTVHGDLNSGSVNAIRAYPGRGIRVFGARTTSPDTAWRYVNVRRLLSMIEETVEEQLQWTVFEPANRLLWLSIERVLTAFLTRLWREGKLDGASPDEAFFVRCDESTNPPQEQELGRVIAMIGLAIAAPMEFVVVRIGVSRDGVDVVGERAR